MSASELASQLGESILAALRELNLGEDAVVSEWVALDAEAERRGKSTRQFRRWCLDHGVEIRQENHRDAWVRPVAVDQAIEGMPVVRSQTPGDEIERELAKVWPENSREDMVSRRSRTRSR